MGDLIWMVRNGSMSWVTFGKFLVLWLLGMYLMVGGFRALERWRLLMEWEQPVGRRGVDAVIETVFWPVYLD